MKYTFYYLVHIMAKVTSKFHENYKLSDLVPYERNNKEHSELQVTEIIKSIEENWFVNPIIVDEKNVILAGHGRRVAAERMGMEEVPVLVVEWMNDKQKKTFRIKANKLADMAWYNIENLKIEIEELNDDSLKDLFVDEIDFSKEDIDITREHTDWAVKESQADKDYDFSKKTIQEIKLTFSPQDYVDFLTNIEQLMEAWYEEDLTLIVMKAVSAANWQD